VLLSAWPRQDHGSKANAAIRALLPPALPLRTERRKNPAQIEILGTSTQTHREGLSLTRRALTPALLPANEYQSFQECCQQGFNRPADQPVRGKPVGGNSTAVECYLAPGVLDPPCWTPSDDSCMIECEPSMVVDKCRSECPPD
jgi:hypothetical protein